MSAPVFVLYHGHCADGFGAATAAWMRYGDQATYLPVHHGHPLPELPDGARVYILDFSYCRETLEALAQRCEVTVLDHHLTAEQSLAGLPFAIFDRTKSGAVLAWEHFHGTPVPALLLYVQDRDLWQWERFRSLEVSAALAMDAESWSFATWKTLIDGGLKAIDSLAHVGECVLAYQKTLVARLVRNAHLVRIAEFEVPAVNSACLQSEIGHALLEAYPASPFAAIYYDGARGQTLWSLRSRPDFDVAALAKRGGGGGHAQAAGFEANAGPISVIIAFPPTA